MACPAGPVLGHPFDSVFDRSLTCASDLTYRGGRDHRRVDRWAPRLDGAHALAVGSRRPGPGRRGRHVELRSDDLAAVRMRGVLDRRGWSVQSAEHALVGEPADNVGVLGVEYGYRGSGRVERIQRLIETVAEENGLWQLDDRGDRGVVVFAVGERVGDRAGGHDTAVAALLVEYGELAVG